MRWEEAKEVLNPDLYDALKVIEDLRATLQLAHYEALDDDEVDESLEAAGEFMRKHGVRDDMLDMKYPPKDGE